MRPDRDEKILRHTGLYRLTFRRVLSELFFEGRTPGNVLGRLIAEGRIRARGGLPDRLCYYQLTLAEARSRGLPLARTRPPRPQAFQTHLGVLWFCFFNGSPYERRRLERDELDRLFPNAAPKGPHVVQGGPVPLVWRVHVTGPRTDDRALVKLLVRRFDRLRRDEALGPWVRSKRYAIAILAETEGRQRRLQEIIARHELTHRTPAVVEYCPGHWTAPAALRAQERRA